MSILAKSALSNLRRLHRGDLEPFIAYRGDPDVARFQNWEVMSPEQARHFLIAMEDVRLFTPGAWAQIGIADAQDHLIGDMGVFLAHDLGHVELGITLARGHWGKGIAENAMRQAIDLVWKQTDVPAIRCWGDQRNLRSIALMRRLGMDHVGTETTDVVEEAFILQRPSKD